MSISARAINRDLQSFVAGQNQLEVFLDPAGSLVKTATGIAVDPSIFAALSWKDNVRSVYSANVALSGVPAVQDGVTLVAGDRVLLSGQTAPAENGIWEVQAGAWTRPADFPAAGDATSVLVAVDEGTSFADTIWRQSAESNNIDTTAQTWATLPIGAPTAGAGIAVSGNTVSLDLGNSIVALGASPAIGDSFVISDADDSGNEKLTTVEEVGQGIIEGATALGANVAVDDVLAITDTDNADALRSVTTSQLVSGVIASSPALTTLADDDLLVASDTSDSGNAKSITVADMRELMGPTIEAHTLTAGEVAARSFVLAAAMESAAKSFTTVLGGKQNYSGDGELTLTAGAAGAATVGWAAGTAGDGSMGGELIAGDIVYVHVV